jgi:glutaminase
VLPGQLAIGVFSPRLDSRGNSVRGVAVCETLSDELGLHFLRAPRPAISAVRSRASLRARGSKRARLAAEREILAAHGTEAAIYQLQGDLGFAGMEAVIRRLVDEPPEVARFVLDFARVSDVDPPSARLFADLYASLVRQSRPMAFAGMARHPRLLRLLDEVRAHQTLLPLVVFEDLDAAVEWCEDALIAAHGPPGSTLEELPLSKHELLHGLDAEEIEWLAGLMERRSFVARETVFLKGDPADELFLLVQGALSVVTDLPGGRVRRLATLSPGVGFGEPSMIEGAVRTASVRADRSTVCWVLARAAFDSLDTSRPPLKIRLLENLLRSATATFGRLSLEAVSEA